MSNDASKRRGSRECTCILNICCSLRIAERVMLFYLFLRHYSAIYIHFSLLYMLRGNTNIDACLRSCAAEKEKSRTREKRGWLIRTCVMTIANHLLNGADTYFRPFSICLLLLSTVKENVSNPNRSIHDRIIVYFVNTTL